MPSSEPEPRPDPGMPSRTNRPDAVEELAPSTQVPPRPPTIARFVVVLPYKLQVALTPYPYGSWTFEIQGMQVEVLSPMRSTVSYAELQSEDGPLGVIDLMNRVGPDPHPPTKTGLTVDGNPVTDADLLVITFRKESFDPEPPAEDPPVDLAFDIANEVLARLRHLMRAVHMKPISAEEGRWRIDYFRTSESASDAPTWAMARVAAGFSMDYAFLSESSWRQAVEVDLSRHPWDALFLDAASHLPEVEPSIVLAYAALESCIDWALDVHVETGGFDADLYKWIANRDGAYVKEPSVREQFSDLLRAVSGRNLKDEKDLWDKLIRLGKARNSIAHVGAAMVDGVAVDAATARALVASAREIIDWVEAGLPEGGRRIKQTEEHTIQQFRNLKMPTTDGAEPATEPGLGVSPRPEDAD